MLLTNKGMRALPVALAWGLALSCGWALGGAAFAQAPVSGTTSSTAVVGAAGAPSRAPLTFEEGMALAKARACLGCHQVDNKRVGPSFRAIAQRQADKNDAVPYLVQVIQKGGRGQWGAVPMPGQPVNNQDAEKLAQWILSLRK
jgi:cytochrome c